MNWVIIGVGLLNNCIRIDQTRWQLSITHWLIMHHKWTLVPTVLTATLHSYGNGQNSTQQNPNLLIDYDKYLHNCLRPGDEYVTQNLCQSIVRERLGRYVKYKALSFFNLIYFHWTRLLKWPVGGFWHTMAKITRNHARKCLWGSTRWPTTFRGSNSPKTVKNGVNMHCRGAS